MTCIFCGGEMVAGPMDLKRCKSCGIYRKHPLPSSDQMKHMTRNFLLSASKNKEKGKLRIEHAHEALEILERYIQIGNLYDIGAAGGFVMKAAKERGWNVDGNELSVACIDWAEKTLGIDIEYGHLEELEVKENHYDAIVMWNTLEHVLNPVTTLDKSKAMLKAGGCLHIEVPIKTEDMIQPQYEAPHTTEFSERGLTDYLKSIGLTELYHNLWNKMEPRGVVTSLDVVYGK